jgi:hypothetical protein
LPGWQPRPPANRGPNRIYLQVIFRKVARGQATLVRGFISTHRSSSAGGGPGNVATASASVMVTCSPSVVSPRELRQRKATEFGLTPDIVTHAATAPTASAMAPGCFGIAGASDASGAIVGDRGVGVNYPERRRPASSGAVSAKDWRRGGAWKGHGFEIVSFVVFSVAGCSIRLPISLASTSCLPTVVRRADPVVVADGNIGKSIMCLEEQVPL